MKRKRERSKREPTIALINIVFLMLVFFMVAGSLAPPLDKDLALVDTRDLDGVAPPDALVVHPDGRLSYRGEAIVDAAAYLAGSDGDAETKVARIVPDRNLPAGQLVALARDLRVAGATSVLIVTERGLE
ncbi:ExbD/TolR family protein [Pseudooceanicola onchidii]|uniref:ExbD/TolR family protein n=1 Tax=Pseudooceanicola onchidii TaxID=2562279 RepID=UPI0010AA3124|nr:biopolymer transporter ExbD [Pseudooceanicola onchidii]